LWFCCADNTKCRRLAAKEKEAAGKLKEAEAKLKELEEKGRGFAVWDCVVHGTVQCPAHVHGVVAPSSA
jgi:hypothetical protein